MWRIAALGVALLSVALGFETRSAEIRVDRSSEPAIISIYGTFGSEDADAFQTHIANLTSAVVVLNSGGGNLVAGIRIGELIRLRNFRTVVPSGMECASACALAWLGGTVRYMGPNARVGFHAAYAIRQGRKTELGVANAILGAYLNKIGLPYNAVIYITQAAPESMSWLTLAEAQRHGIAVEPFPERDTTTDRVRSSPERVEPPARKPERAVVEVLDTRAREFLFSMMARTSASNSTMLSSLEDLYADEVLYHGKSISRVQVMEDKKRYASRWPNRSYNVLPDSIIVRCDVATLMCDISAHFEWRVESPQRKSIASGTARVSYRLSMGVSSPIIHSEDGAVVRRDARNVSVPPIIHRSISDQFRTADCVAKIDLAPAMISVDLNADGVPDYVIDFDRIPCTKASLAQALQNCGTGGCLTEVWLSGHDTWRLVSSGVLRGVKKGRRRQNRDTLIIATHGSSCDQVGYKSCIYEAWWDGTKFDRAPLSVRKCGANERAWDCEPG
jgi:ATP-dependent protease ClpP protease subunit